MRLICGFCGSEMLCVGNSEEVKIPSLVGGPVRKLLGNYNIQSEISKSLKYFEGVVEACCNKGDRTGMF